MIAYRNPNGTYKRIRVVWSLDNFNDGYVDNKGRFRVWMPNHPRAYKEGYILRSIVAYEAYFGDSVPENMDVHHIDGDKLNDSKENLMLLLHNKHSTLSNIDKTSNIERTCLCCGKIFLIKRWRLKDLNRGKYCSQRCYRSKVRIYNV